MAFWNYTVNLHENDPCRNAISIMLRIVLPHECSSVNLLHILGKPLCRKTFEGMFPKKIFKITPTCKRQGSSFNTNFILVKPVISSNKRNNIFWNLFLTIFPIHQNQYDYIYPNYNSACYQCNWILFKVQFLGKWK